MTVRAPDVFAKPLLVSMLQAFVDGSDRSKRLVEWIEYVVVDAYRATELYDRLSLPTALYEPDGGEDMYDPDMLIPEFVWALDWLAPRYLKGRRDSNGADGS